ncbi:MAG: hydroxymyristoyl-ACP dehydratase [Defluviitaleaceae bacterium]|nr:hydroxymyristoyl-ACP dehydratase [Defluviitaleaceae bacterium]MCL2274007.1 hydroxymyristoyl-ACP dehydratase [Defluviitaleaceae bacterium]MCL2274092.1 hydroxymyristoyl-ACP dehydratase [Defluviitaleaceae bacterium]
MDINCTHQCFYQKDGKCNLQELPLITSNTYAAHDVDCPYFSETYTVASPRGHGFM